MLNRNTHSSEKFHDSQNPCCHLKLFTDQKFFEFPKQVPFK